MNKEETNIVFHHMVDRIPKITRPLLIKLNTHTDNTKLLDDEHIYPALNCHLLAETIKFLAAKI